jgi:anthranilate phosphoribosyltransferase
VGELTQAIATVGRGVTKAKPLPPDVAEAAMETILSGRADPFELGALLIALRVKEETAEELVAFARVAERHLTKVPGPPAALTVSSYAGKRQTFPVLLAGACVLAALGVRVGIHGHATPPGRTSLADVLGVLGAFGGGDPKASPDAAATHLARAGVAYVGIEAFFPVMHAMLELRRKMGLRSCFHTMARLVNPFGATHSIVGISHERTFEKFARACHALGYTGVVAFRGLEGEAEPNPLTPTEGLRLDAEGAVTPFPIDPQALGIPKANRAGLLAEGPVEGAELVRKVLAGEASEVAREAVALCAACGLLTVGAEPDLAEGMSKAREVLDAKGGQEALALWLGG